MTYHKLHIAFILALLKIEAVSCTDAQWHQTEPMNVDCKLKHMAYLFCSSIVHGRKHFILEPCEIITSYVLKKMLLDIL